MEVTKFVNFKPKQVRRVVFDGASYGVISIDETHYIGAFLSSAQASLVSLDGLRVNILSRTGDQDIDITSSLVDSEVHRIPTGISNSSISQRRPRAFKYDNMVIFERPSLSITEFELYGDDDILLGKVSGLTNVDRLVILTDHDIDYQRYHEQSRHPHRFDKNLLVQSMVNSFSALSPKDVLINEAPKFNGIPSVFQRLRSHKNVLVDAYLEVGEHLTWRGIYRYYLDNQLPAFTDKSY